MAAAGWPASVYDGRVGIRPLRMRDAAVWSELRMQNEEWLAPWDGRAPGAPDTPWRDRNSPTAFGVALRTERRTARNGHRLPFAIELDSTLVGQVTVANVVRGAFQSGAVGYWVSQHVAGQGVMPTALALVVDHCFGPVGLHRLEANIRPENVASRRVVTKLGFREEGVHPRFLFIDGAWRDHVTYALTAEDVPDGLLSRWTAQRGL